MIKVLFVCHGNICRSPMAKMIMTRLIEQAGLEKQIAIDSAATSTEELGNGIYPPARAELQRRGVPVLPHRARQMTLRDAEESDLLVCMDQWNKRNMLRITADRYSEKMHLLGEWGHGGEVSDPWYTDRFDIAYEQILAGCTALLEELQGRV